MAKHLRARVGYFVLLASIGALGAGLAHPETPASPDPGRESSGDAQHQFDFNLGTWNTHIKRRLRPLTGSDDWVELSGKVAINKVWDGRAQIEEIEADGPKGHFEALTLFLYNPQSHQWNISFANRDDGVLSQPAIGEFRNGRGEFFDQEIYNGKAIFVRVVWSEISANSHRFEQFFSADGGKTWESNFVAMLSRATGDGPVAPLLSADTPPAQHDFDWQLGRWAVHIERLQQPLTTGSTAWSKLDGTVAVRKLWGGRANLAEIAADGTTGKLEFLSLRLFNPKARQWSLNFANSKVGVLSTPMVGEFRNGRGEFYDQEPFNDRTIFVRFVFDNATPGSHRDEQAFSDDGGKTWEVNWVNTSKRLSD